MEQEQTQTYLVEQRMGRLIFLTSETIMNLMKIVGNNRRALCDVCPRLSPLVSHNPVTWSLSWVVNSRTHLTINLFNGGLYDSRR